MFFKILEQLEKEKNVRIANGKTEWVQFQTISDGKQNVVSF